MRAWFDAGINLKGRTAGIAKTKCPNCHPTRKNKTDDSLYCNVTKGFAICYNCGWVFNARNDERYRKVREKADLPKKIEPYSKAFIEYFLGRGISEDTLLRTFTYEKRMSYRGLPPNQTGIVICWPVHYQYSLVNVKYRALNSKVFWQLSSDDGALQTLSGLDHLETVNKIRSGEDKKIAQMIITEGEMDRLSYYEAGLPAVTLPSGATQSLPWWKPELAKLFDLVEEVIIAVDADAAGLGVRDELARRIGKAKCKYAVYPPNAKDANDVIREAPLRKEDGTEVPAPYGHLPHADRLEMLRNTIKNARPVPYEGLVVIRESFSSVDKVFADKLTPGWRRGNKLDKRFTYKPGLLYVLTGTPGTGKSHFIIDDLNKLAEYQRKMGLHLKFGVYSPENKNPGRLSAKIISLQQGASYIYNHPNQITLDRHRAGKRFVDEHYVFLFPDKNSDPNTLDGILKIGSVAVKQHGINGLVIDPWNKIEHEMARGETENNYISRTLDQIYEFSEVNGVFVVIVAHPTKPVNRDKSGNYGRVTLYSISGSANWYNKPDVGIILHRDKYDKDGNFIDNGPTKVVVEKMRFEEIGNEGSDEIYYDWWRGGRFVDDDTQLDQRNFHKQKLKDEQEKEFEKNEDEDDTPF